MTFSADILDDDSAFFAFKQDNPKVRRDYSPINRNDFGKLINGIATKFDYDPNLLKAHSLRVGGASYYYKRNMPAHLIQMMGRWKSQCWLKYVRVSASESVFF